MLQGKFYKAASHGVDADDPVGGAIDLGSPLAGSLHEIFPQAQSDFLGGDNWDRFQKIYWRNTGAATITEARAFLEDIKYAGQIKVALEKVADDTGARFDSMPSGYNTGDFGEPDGLAEATGDYTLTGGSDFAFWVWQRIPPGLDDADPAVPLNIRIAGVTT